MPWLWILEKFFCFPQKSIAPGLELNYKFNFIQGYFNEKSYSGKTEEDSQQIPLAKMSLTDYRDHIDRVITTLYTVVNNTSKHPVNDEISDKMCSFLIALKGQLKIIENEFFTDYPITSAEPEVVSNSTEASLTGETANSEDSDG